MLTQVTLTRADLSPSHLLEVDHAVAVLVVETECPAQLGLRAPFRVAEQGDHELLEVDCAALVCVEEPEDVPAESLRIAAGKYPGVDLHILGPSQLPRGAVSQEALEPVLVTSLTLD